MNLEKLDCLKQVEVHKKVQGKLNLIAKPTTYLEK